MEGAYGVFGVTDCTSIKFFQHLLYSLPTRQSGLRMAKKKLTVKTSSMQQSKPVSNTLYGVHSTTRLSKFPTLKPKPTSTITSSHLAFLTHRESLSGFRKLTRLTLCSLYTSWFYENFGAFQFVKRGEDGALHYDATVPSDAPFVCISGKDCGVLAGVALKNSEKYIGSSPFSNPFQV